MATVRGKCSACGAPLELAVADSFARAALATALCPGCTDQLFLDGGGAILRLRQEPEGALFLLGKPAEAQSLLDQLKDEGLRDPRACDLVAELLVERSDLAGALDWATAGVELCLQRRSNGGLSQPGPAGDSPGGDDDAESELRLLLSLRYRIRNDLGLPEDRYDELLDEA